METIKNYLETMFANMPNTEAVKRAKDELWQMMEDKYTELIEAGKSENEAIGTVISEFGNLEELSEILGLKNEFVYTEKKASEEHRVLLSMDECKRYLKDKASHAYRLSLGIFFCINSVIAPIIVEAFRFNEGISVAFFMLFVAIGVGLIVSSGISMLKWKQLQEGNYQIDFATSGYVYDENEKFANTFNLYLTLGIVLCVISWVPAAVASEFKFNFSFVNLEELASTLIFLFTGVGVMLIVYASNVRGGYKLLLNMNGTDTISGDYKIQLNEKKVSEERGFLSFVLSVYWHTIACVYLIESFLTFRWHTTWIIWPIAAIVFKLLENINNGEDR